MLKHIRNVNIRIIEKIQVELKCTLSKKASFSKKYFCKDNDKCNKLFHKSNLVIAGVENNLNRYFSIFKVLACAI